MKNLFKDITPGDHEPETLSAAAIASAYNVSKQQAVVMESAAKWVFSWMQRKSEREITVVKSSRDSFLLLRNRMWPLDHEVFYALVLANNSRVIQVIKLSSGGVTGTAVDLKILFKNVLFSGATAMIVAHNHPSGNAKPSQQDIDFTKRISAAATFLDIQLLDHIIVAGFESYYSFSDEGLML